mgnify:CR=1 FL=1
MHMTSPMPPDAFLRNGFVNATEVASARQQDLPYADQLYRADSVVALPDTVAPSGFAAMSSSVQTSFNMLAQFPLLAVVMVTILILLALYSHRRYGSRRQVIGSEVLPSKPVLHVTLSSATVGMRDDLNDR